MGIRVQCPHGHSTKVKDQYAGKKVLCPQCGVTIRVPKTAPVPGVPGSLPMARGVPLDPQVIATLPRAVALNVVSAAAAVPAASDVMPPAFATQVYPLIAEQPAASWSLSVPGGQASALMTGAELQQWLEARQATGSELVWRSDWPDWVPIAQAFPDCVPPAAP